MVKDILIGLSVGVVAGAFLAKVNKPCSDAVDKVTEMADDAMKNMKESKTKTDKDCDCKQSSK